MHYKHLKHHSYPVQTLWQMNGIASSLVHLAAAKILQVSNSRWRVLDFVPAHKYAFRNESIEEVDTAEENTLRPFPVRDPRKSACPTLFAARTGYEKDLPL
mmetsp:Transcript_28923/g.54356  ORF Transcript_28923/g.54356 Transcript_28923/m.54356 type:complete len:101 (-) Transcript_28923:161-463(-)